MKTILRLAFGFPIIIILSVLCVILWFFGWIFDAEWLSEAWTDLKTIHKRYWTGK